MDLVPDQPPPVADRVPHRLTAHGETRVDDYYWMRERGAPAVTAYLEAENAYAKAALEPTVELQERLFQEIVGRIQETDLDVPVRLRGYFYYSRTEAGKQYRIYCRKAGTLDGDEQVVLDLNRIEAPFVDLDSYQVTDDGDLLAYSLDLTGYRQYELRFKDLRTGAEIGFRAPRVTSLAWAADGLTLFFVQEDEVTKRSHRLYRQRLDEAEPTLVYQEDDERFRLRVARTRSRRFVLLTVASHTTSEVRVLDAADPDAEPRLVAPRVQDREYYLDHRGDRFYIRTNDAGRNFRIAVAPVATPDPEHWETLVPHDDGVMLAGMAVFAHHVVLFEREDGLPHLHVLPDFGQPHRIELPEAVYDVRLGANPEFDVSVVRYGYESMTTPPSVYEYDIGSRRSKLLKRTEVLGDYDPDRYVAERRYAPARDGTRIPVSLVRRKHVEPDGDRPVFLVGYGSYGFSYPVSFSHARVSLLERGVVCAVAHIRGGGELGKAWHDAGRMRNKMNTFLDFIDAAEFLVKSGWTRPQRLAIEGGSAGGLLMGVVANLRPDLFRCVVSLVPFVDVLTTMSDETLPLTVGEFEEWGNPAVEEDYRYIRRYCPYSNLHAGPYPAMLVRTSLNDSQVMYWEPAKYVAKLRTLETAGQALIFVTNMEGGHGGSSGRYDRFREIAMDYAFVLWQLGIRA